MTHPLRRGKAIIKKVPGKDVWLSHGLGDPDFLITGVGDSPAQAFSMMRDGIQEYRLEQAVDGYRQVGPC